MVNVQGGTPGRLPPAQSAHCQAATGKRTQRHPQDGTESKLIYKKKKERKEQRKENFTENFEQKKGAKMQRKRNTGTGETRGLVGDQALAESLGSCLPHRRRRRTGVERH